MKYLIKQKKIKNKCGVLWVIVVKNQFFRYFGYVWCVLLINMDVIYFFCKFMENIKLDINIE